MELAPVIKHRFFDSNGDPLVGGKLYSYVANSTTPVTTYTTREGLPGDANTNPIILDANGECDLWIGPGYYKFVLADANDVVQWTKDKVSLASEAALASAFWRDVVYITSADSPYTISQTHNGKLIAVDSTSGAVAINLPEINAMVLPFNIGVKLKTGTNTVTINRSGTDTINTATTKIITGAGVGIQIVADIDKSPDDWETIDFGTVADGAISAVKLASEAASPDGILNYSIVTSVGSNNMTIALKTLAGLDPSVSSPAMVSFRNATAGTGNWVQRSATAATSIVISSGATLGHTSAVNQYIYLCAIDNAGIVELAVIGSRFDLDEGSLVSTTGISSGSTDWNTLYSNSARTNVAFRILGRIRVNEATAGTWATNSNEISLAIQGATTWPVATMWKQNSYTFTPDATAQGTVTGNKNRSRRVGSSIEVFGYWTNGIPTANPAKLALPSGMTVDSGILTADTNLQHCGMYYLNRSIKTGYGNSNFFGIMFYDGSDATKLYFCYGGNSNAFEKDNGNDIAATDGTTAYDFMIPIKEWRSY